MAASIDPELLATAITRAAPPRTDMVGLAKALAALKTAHPRQMKQVFAECGLKPATGYALAAIGARLSKYGADESRLNAIGWGKLSQLLPHLTAANAAELLELAESVSERRLAAILSGDMPPPDAIRISFDLARPCHSALVSALRANGAHLTRRGLRRKETALMRLVGVLHVPTSSTPTERSKRWKTTRKS
jgi:hypothetical protein